MGAQLRPTTILHTPTLPAQLRPTIPAASSHTSPPACNHALASTAPPGSTGQFQIPTQRTCLAPVCLTRSPIQLVLVCTHGRRHQFLLSLTVHVKCKSCKSDSPVSAVQYAQVRLCSYLATAAR